MLITELAGHVI